MDKYLKMTIWIVYFCSAVCLQFKLYSPDDGGAGGGGGGKNPLGGGGGIGWNDFQNE